MAFKTVWSAVVFFFFLACCFLPCFPCPVRHKHICLKKFESSDFDLETQLWDFLTEWKKCAQCPCHIILHYRFPACLCVSVCGSPARCYNTAPCSTLLKHTNLARALLSAVYSCSAVFPPHQHLHRGHCLAHWRRGQSLRIKLHFTHSKPACFDARRRHRGVVAVWISVRDKLWLLCRGEEEGSSGSSSKATVSPQRQEPLSGWKNTAS